jgi:hypothetical protein
MINHENNGPAEDDPMDQVDQEFAKPSPDAPAPLSRLAFLLEDGAAKQK